MFTQISKIDIKYCKLLINYGILSLIRMHLYYPIEILIEISKLIESITIIFKYDLWSSIELIFESDIWYSCIEKSILQLMNSTKFLLMFNMKEILIPITNTYKKMQMDLIMSYYYFSFDLLVLW